MSSPKRRKRADSDKIGSLTIQEANRIAKNVTGHFLIDLEMASNSGYTHRKTLCMFCLKTTEILKKHVVKYHSEHSELSEVVEVMKRLSDVRYLRYCTNRHLTNTKINQMFPNVPRVPLINVLTNLGFVFCENRQKKTKKKRSVDFEKKYEEESIRGICLEKVMEIIGRFENDDIRFKKEFELFSDLVTSTRMADPSTQTNIFCYLCRKDINNRNFSRHMKLHEDEDLIHVFKRISDVQNDIYFESQPVHISEIHNVCHLNDQLVEFLMDSGFVIDYGEMKKTDRKWKIMAFDPEMEEMPDLTTSEEPESSISEVSESRSRASSVTSDTSSVSSTSSTGSRITIRPCSAPDEEPFPYCVLNAIPEHTEVEHALFDLLEAMTDDTNFELDQSQYSFLLGYTSYCLVVGNGCKQNIVSKLTMADYRNARVDETSGLTYFSFSTKSSFSQNDLIEFVAADERIWRAMEIFEVARERRSRRMDWKNAFDDSAPFFTSFSSPLPILKDTNYAMSQFIRMCGLDFACRSSAICSAVWSLVRRDLNKTAHWQYAVTYFRILREKERQQAQLVTGGLQKHPSLMAIRFVSIGTKSWKKTVEKKEKKKEKTMSRHSEKLLERIGRQVRQMDELGEKIEIERFFDRMEVDQNPPDVENEPSTSADQSERQEDVDNDDHLMCRVCRGNDGNLYYPCLCTGSIKYVHQECLVEWLKYSKKEVCELCNHKYSFQPIYRPDMPKALPILEILRGVSVSGLQMLKTWLVYTFVMATWLGIVPLTAARIYNCIFYLSFHDIVSTPIQLIKVDHVFNDILKGSLLLVVFVCTFISLVWLREQIIVGGPQHFLNIEIGNDPDGLLNYDVSTDEEGDDEEEDDDDDEEDDDDDDEDTDVEDEHFVQRIGRGDRLLNEEDMIHHGPIIDRIYGLVPDQYDDMRDDENEIVENEPDPRDEVPDFDAPPPPERHEDDELYVPEDPQPPPLEPEPLAPRAAARANRRLRRQQQRENAELLEQQAAADQDDNWREWDRFGDELTWQRLLGLDGSLIFLEHVFWVISLNTLFTITFAYMPYRFGNWLLGVIGLHGKITYFPSIVAMLLGYVQIAAYTFLLHQLMRVLRMRLMYRFLGVMFLIIKVFLLVFIEIGFFPVMCGCWMDVCTLPLFNVTLSQRIATFATAPFMSIFLHWMVGMVYVFYSASFVILLREILRPGVLWFMRNLNDPDFNPIQEMIDLPFSRHLRRLVVSTTLFFSTILLIFYIPLNIISVLIPRLLPYNVSMSAETPLSELSLELLILQVVMPAILEHANGRTFIKVAVRFWCKMVGKALDLDRYLLSDNNNNNAPNNNDPMRAGNQAGGGLAAEHQALLLLREPRAYEPYERPSMFAARITVLMVCMSVTTTLSSVVLFIVPATIGRAIIHLLTAHSNVHEIYTVAVGLYACWLIGKAVAIVYKFVQGGPHLFKRAVMHYSYLGMRLFFVATPIIVVLPLLMGTVFQLMFLTPMRLGYQQTALMFPYQDWAMGVVQMKIFGVIAMMGPDWWLKSELDLLVQRGVENFAALHVLVRIVVPCTLYLSSAIAFPVVVIKTYAFIAGADPEWTMLVLRFSYPAFLIIGSAVLFVKWQITKFAELAEKIKNDRYLVGTQLVNYERNGTARV